MCVCVCVSCVCGVHVHTHYSHFSNVRAVLQGACHMVAMEIAHEPLVRQAVRQVFRTRAVLHIKPTKKGKKASGGLL